MKKLNAEKCRDRLRELQLAKTFGGISLKEQNYFEALEIALPVLEQQKAVTKKIECPFPCGWENLLRISMSDGAFLAKDLIEGEEVKDIHRHAAFNNTDRLVSVITAILNAQREPLQESCVKCGGTGEMDSGGTQPWGEQILVECDCQFEQQERERGEEE